MNELKEAAKSGGNLMTVFGVIAIILGMLAMLTPGLTGMSVIIMLGARPVRRHRQDHLGLPGGQFRQGAADVRYWRADLALWYCTPRQSAVRIRGPDHPAGCLLHHRWHLRDCRGDPAATGLWMGLDVIRRDRIDSARFDDLGSVPAVWRVGHWHPAGH